jgi:hypothetical protein
MKIEHMLQYAIAGDQIVNHSENMTNDEILEKTRPRGVRDAEVERYNRCPVREEWTTASGELRKNSDCPAVIEALAKGLRTVPAYKLVQVPEKG